MQKHYTAAVTIAALTLASAAYAASVHFVPKVTSPVWADQGLTLSENGKLSGLGNGDIRINLSATANATAVCINPGSGQHEPPGHNPAPVTVGGVEIIPMSAVKNGTVSFSVTTVAPTSPIPSDSPGFGCPNPNWSEVITDLSFTTADTTVEQPIGVTKYHVACIFDPATANGVVPSQTVSCSAAAN